MPDTHDFTFGSLSGDFQTVGKALTAHKQAMVAGCFKGGRKPLEEILRVVKDGGGLAVHQASCANHFTAIDITHALVTEADSENRYLPSKVTDHVTADSSLFRRAGARRDADALWCHCLDLGESDLVVSLHEGIGSQLAEILDEVVGERIVIIDDEDHDRKVVLSVAAASSIARMTPMALFTVSSYSEAALESATTPAPACT